MPVDIGKLETPNQAAQPPAAFLFEPQPLVDFTQAWRWQQQWQDGMLLAGGTPRSEVEIAQCPEAVWLLQHPACYTLGRGASERHVLFDLAHPPAPLHRIDRGGEVTHHMPGQLVAYPVLDLRRHQCDLHWYLRQLEHVVIDVLAQVGLVGERVDGLTGVWLEGRKVAAIGVGCRRWITQHGLALNVNGDLSGFAAVVPCGLTGKPVGRLSDWIPGITLAEVQPLVRDALAKCFGLRWQPPGHGQRWLEIADHRQG
ncbi:MAG: lipoyl(octanoyl) transferase LipB [Synechococcus sp.]